MNQYIVNWCVLPVLVLMNAHVLMYQHIGLYEKSVLLWYALTLSLAFLQLCGAYLMSGDTYGAQSLYYLMNLWVLYSTYAVYLHAQDADAFMLASTFALTCVNGQFMYATMNVIESTGVYYLASPYTHPDPIVRETRFRAVQILAQQLMRRGYTLIEPIAASHYKATRLNQSGLYTDWQTFCRKLVGVSDGVIVASCIPGWEQSHGVQDEIWYARQLGKPVFFVHKLVNDCNPEPVVQRMARD